MQKFDWLKFHIVLTFSIVSNAYAYITGNGSHVPLKDVTLKECIQASDSAECFWVDSMNRPVMAKDGAISKWTISASQWAQSSLHEPFEVSDGMNEEVLDHLLNPKSIETAGDIVNDFRPFPAFVLSDPTNRDRRNRTYNLLRSIGIAENISFVPFTEAENFDIEHLRASNSVDQATIERMLRSTWIGARALKAYLANAMDHLNAVRMGVNAGYDLFGIFEDNLMLAGSKGTVGYRIKTALQRYPPTADLLYLEACHEKCSERKFSYHYPLWARTTGPSCSAAIIFTKKGAHRISVLCKSIFWGIHNMYATLIRAGLVEGYVITPTAFFQNGYWSSALQPLRGSRNGRRIGDRAKPGVTHRPFSIMCNENANELRLTHLQISEETEYLRKCFDTLKDASFPAKMVLVSDTLTDDPETDMEKESVLYFTKSASNTDKWVEVGRWPNELGEEGVVLCIDRDSFCFINLERGNCTFKIKSIYKEDDQEITKYVEMGDLLFVHHRIDSEADIILRSFSLVKQACVAGEDNDLFISRTMHKAAISKLSGTSEHGSAHEDVTSIKEKNAHGMLQQDAPIRTMGNQSLGPLLTGVHFIFDGIMFKLSSGKMSGVNKMWYNIVPYMADVVHSLNGTFTHCQSSWQSDKGPAVVDIPRVRNLPGCDNLSQTVTMLPGMYKIVFSSHYRIAELSEEHRVCNILPLYDFIPERMGVYHQQHPAFYSKAQNIPRASGFLSLSPSTTDDLEELYGVNKEFVSTSPSRVSKIFTRVDPYVNVQFDGDFQRSEEVQKLLNSGKPFLLLIGFSPSSPEYKGYDIFWNALETMPAEFKEEISVLIIGELPNHHIDLVVEYSPDVPEYVLPILYSRATALVHPSRYEGFGMPPIEAIACGCPVILGSFYQNKMQYLYGDDALYAGNVKQMQDALFRVYSGDLPPPQALIARAKRYGGDPRFGWNEVAKDYLTYMLSGPFIETEVSKCSSINPRFVQNPSPLPLWSAVEIQTNADGLQVEVKSDAIELVAGYNDTVKSQHNDTNFLKSETLVQSHLVFLVNSPVVYRTSLPFCRGRCFAPCLKWPCILPFASMPRSGTTFVRRVFEAAVGVATEAEYDEGGTCQRIVDFAQGSVHLFTDCIDDWADYKIGNNSSDPAFHHIKQLESQCRTILCGCSSGESKFPLLCKADESVHPILMKTHFPFRQSKQNYFPFRSPSTMPSFPGFLVTARNPLTNYDAWRRFLSHAKHKGVEKTQFRKFVDSWAAQIHFWRNLAEETNTVLLIVRYEDLMERPFSTFEHLFINMGILDFSSITSETIKKAVDFAIQQHAALNITYPISTCKRELDNGPFGIPNYSNTDECGPNVELEDIIWLNQKYGEVLSDLGYDISIDPYVD